MKANQKERIDKLLVEKGLVESREKAKALIMAGQIIVEDKRVDKAGEMVPIDGDIRIRGKLMPYVSRGGLKLEEALRHFNIDVDGKLAIDVGASTGGFTDCLLQNGAAKVYAVDVGYGQMALRVKNDPRVICIERTNIREMPEEAVPEKVDIAVTDVSFISLTKVLPHIILLLKKKGELVALIKPQFEVGKGEVGKGGIVKDEKKIESVIESIKAFCTDLGLSVEGVTPSPVLGAKGNREFLIYLTTTFQG
ncbi:MAG: TlyA family RNA methyltransferase [Proteobacteria bacterium]|nr:TlyA family RNA methyltransferase [Pseudomonadota bacterium]